MRVPNADWICTQNQRFGFARKRLRLGATPVQCGLRNISDTRGLGFRDIFFWNAAAISRVSLCKETVARAPEAAFNLFKISQHELQKQRQLTAVRIGRERIRRLWKARFVSIESLRGKVCRTFHLRLHVTDLRADSQPKDRNQQECERNADDNDQQPKRNKRRTKR